MTIHSNLILELSTDNDEIRYTHEQNSVNWRSKLSTEEYIEREHVVRMGSEICKRDPITNLGLYHFVLKDLSIPVIHNKFDQIVAACETRNTIGYVAKPGTTELIEVVSPCIGSVYTLPHHRKKGYAAKMILLLNQYWDNILGNDYFTTLYSEVGDYYSRVGYQNFEVLDHKLKTKASDNAVGISDYKLLEMDQFQDLIKAENELLKKDLLAKAQISDKRIIASKLSNDNFNWYHLRDRFMNTKLNRTSKPTSRAGAMLQTDTGDDHVIWEHNWLSDSVTILKLKFTSLDSFKKLIALTHNEAHLNKLNTVEIWDSALSKTSKLYNEAREYLKSHYEGEFDQPNSSVSAARIPEDGVEFEWEYNEKWCWF